MNNHNKTEFKSHEGDGPIDHISVNNNKNDHFEKYLDLPTIEEDRRNRRELDQRFGGVGNESVANRKKAKKGPLHKLLIATGVALAASGLILAGKVDKDFLDESKRLEEQNKKNVVDDNILYGEDISRLITPSGKVFTVRTDGRSREEIEGILNKMANKTTKRKFGNDTIGE